MRQTDLGLNLSIRRTRKRAFLDERARALRAIVLASLFSLSIAATPAQAGTATYTYDPLGRVTQVSYSNGTVITYTYDAAGNRTRTVTRGVR